MYQSVKRTSRASVLLIKTIVFLTFSLTSSSLLLQPSSQGLSSSRPPGREEERHWERGWSLLLFSRRLKIAEVKLSIPRAILGVSFSVPLFSLGVIQ